MARFPFAHVRSAPPVAPGVHGSVLYGPARCRWANGQDQCAKIKSGLTAVVRSMRVLVYRPAPLFAPALSPPARISHHPFLSRASLCAAPTHPPTRTQVFLDVDDLEDLIYLERDIKASAVVLLFLTKSYFKSINCLREVRACEEEDKPLILVREMATNKGGALMEDMKEECPEDLRRFVFSDAHTAKIIPFYRLG